MPTDEDTKVEIAYDDRGHAGPALLGLPGWCGDRTVFTPLLDAMAPGRRVLAMDWRGHGGSTRSTADFGTEELVEDAVTVIDAAGTGPVVPVALAHAGWVA